MAITPEMHSVIIEKGKRIWNELHSNPREHDVVGELKKTKLQFDGKEYDLEIDCYWDRSNYFDYHVRGNGVDCQKFVACWM